jgi:hypothetical protein
MDIIRRYLITGIIDRIEKVLKVHGTNFIYFNSPVSDPKFGEIDRVNKWAPFRKDEMHPVGYSLLSGSTLLKIWKNIQRDKLHYYCFNKGKYKKVKLK